MGAGSFFSRVKDTVSHVVDSFIPVPEDEDEDVEIQEEQDTLSAYTAYTAQGIASEQRVVNGGTVSSFSSPSYGSSFQNQRPPVNGDGGTPPLTVHTTKVSELRVRIHRPRRYDDAGPAVTQLKQGVAIAVNFDCMNPPERRRVCDFLNGACYVIHGTAHVVSSTIILYAPKGVDVTEALATVQTN